MRSIDLDASTVAILAVVTVGGFLLWRASSAVGDAVGDALGAVPEVVGETYEFLKENGGVPVVLGDVFGVPRTSQTACERAKAEGRLLDVSLYCPATDFFRYLRS